MADHVPAQPARAQGDFGLGLLHLVFAEQAQAQRGCGTDRFRRLALRHRHESDRARLAPRALAGSLDSLLNGLQIGL